MSVFESNPSALLGKRTDDPDVVAFLSSLDAKPKFTKSEERLDWSSKKAGLVSYAHLGTGRITTVFFYSKGHERYQQYGHPLPKALSFSMTRDQVKAVMGAPPNFHDTDFDTWDLDDQRLVVEYDPSGKILLVTATGDF